MRNRTRGKPIERDEGIFGSATQRQLREQRQHACAVQRDIELGSGGLKKARNAGAHGCVVSSAGKISRGAPGGIIVRACTSREAIDAYAIA